MIVRVQREEHLIVEISKKMDKQEEEEEDMSFQRLRGQKNFICEAYFLLRMFCFQFLITPTIIT